MATISEDAVEVLDEALKVEGGGDAESSSASAATANTIPKTENWEMELSTFKTNSGISEPSVLCVAQDKTDSTWQKSRYNYSLPLSSSVTDLYSAIAKEAGYLEGTFDLIWRKQTTDGPGEEEVALEWKSSATLHEMGMPSEPIKSYLLIRERQDGTTPQRAQQDTTVSSTSSSSASVKINNPSSSSYTTNYNNSYSYSNYSYNMKSETGFVGLVNQAMTCYLNSLLQTLYMTPEFRNALYSWRFQGESRETSKSIPYQLQRLFIQLQTSCKRAVETTDVTKSFGWDGSEAWQQHDVQELCRVMFDALERQFQKDKYERPDLINELYQGTMKDYVKCLKCGYESAREDHFLDIPLVIKPFGSTTTHGSVEEALQGFVQPETLEGDNQYFCEKCDSKCDAHKGLKFTRFPYLLTLQLKRFDFDSTTLYRMKLNDRMTFPKVLNLNTFIDPADMPPPPDHDLDEVYRDYVVERFEPPPRPPPYSSYARSSGGTSYDMKYQGGSYTIQNITETPSHPTIKISNDNEESQHDATAHDQLAEENQREEGEEGQDAGQSGTTTDRKTVAQLLKQGPYVYELFSIMIHSGSAIGGHYYAYIKSFANRQWYCFNDQSVSKVTEEDIEQTFGGSDARTRGYYSSMYASSANAYMLMYRRVDKPRNTMFISTEELPPHIKKQIEDEREYEKREKERQEYERNLCKLRVFCRHPHTGEVIERKLEIHKDKSFRDTVKEAHQLLDLERYVSLERCRLVKYDDYSETLDQSFEDQEDVPLGQVVGGPRSYYSYELFMEIRAEGEVFKVYKKGGLNLKVIVVDVERREACDPVFLRAEQGWRVAELKTEIAERLNLSADTMRVALETYQSAGKHLADPQSLLKDESFYRKHTVFVCCDAEDCKKNFHDSEMNRLIDQYTNSILLNITIPPPPRKKTKVAEEDTIMESSVDSPAGDQQTGSSVPQQQSAEGHTEGDTMQQGSSSERPASPTLSSQDQRKSDETVQEKATDSGQQEREGEERQLAEAEGSRGGVEEDRSMTEDRPLQRDIQVRIDRRSTLADLKELLEKHVQQPSSNFKIYRVYSNNQEYEIFRLTDTLMTVPNETRMIVRLGRALKPGEFRIRLFLLRMREVEFCKPLMDSIVAKGMTVFEFKERIVKEAYDQGIEYPLRADRIRLRKKTWRTAGTIYLNHQVFEKDIHVFAHFEMYVEPLEDADQMIYPTQMQVYLRHWRPSSFTVDPIQEIIMDGNGLDHLRKKISEVSEIPVERVEFAKSYGSFPSEMSVLEVEDELEWNPSVPAVSSMPLSIYDDGAILYYKDSAERLADLSPEKRNELQKQENTRLSKFNPSGTSHSYYRPKEKALKIYTEDDENEKERTSN